MSKSSDAKKKAAADERKARETERKARVKAEKEAANTPEAKAAKKAEQEAYAAKIEKSLVPVAREINVRLEKVNELDGKANDHRLAAALKLNEAKVACEDAGISFKTWAETNVKTQSYETIRKLAYVGASEDPKLALEDMRGKNKAANKQHRDRKKAGASHDRKISGPAKAPFTVAEEAVAALDDKVQAEFLKSRAKKLGLAVVSPDQVTTAKAVVKPVGGSETLKAAFSALKAGEKMTFLRWGADQIGARIDTSEFDASVAEPKDGSPPAFLRRKATRRVANGAAEADVAAAV